MKCDFAGCKNEAIYRLVHRWNSGQTCTCSKHTPKWATDPNYIDPKLAKLEAKLGRKMPKCYDAIKIEA